MKLIAIKMSNCINDILYAAGYIDGDGCFYVGTHNQKHKNITAYEYSIQVSSVRIESLNFLKANFGGFIRQKPVKLRHKITYCWTLKEKRMLLDFAKSISPFLIDKRIQCDYFVKLAEIIAPNCGIKVDQDILDIRNNYIAKIKDNKHLQDFVSNKQDIEAIKSLDSIYPEEYSYPYLAGLIDAEGSFRVKKWKPKNKPNYVYAICLEIGNTRKPIFEFIVPRFRGNLIFSKPNNIRSNCLAIWSISALALSKLLPKLMPFLIIKKEVAEKVVEFSHTNLPNGGDRHSDKFKKSYQEIIAIREKIVDSIHKLNQKGMQLIPQDSLD
jgi:hypothetical protein